MLETDHTLGDDMRWCSCLHCAVFFFFSCLTLMTQAKATLRTEMRSHTHPYMSHSLLFRRPLFPPISCSLLSPSRQLEDLAKVSIKGQVVQAAKMPSASSLRRVVGKEPQGRARCVRLPFTAVFFSLHESSTCPVCRG